VEETACIIKQASFISLVQNKLHRKEREGKKQYKRREWARRFVEDYLRA